MDELKLILVDNNNSVEVIVNKDNLIKKCKYFDNLLNKYYSSCENKIIIVPNSLVSKNIIENLFEIDSTINYEISYILELVKCYDFFGLEFDLKKFNIPKINHNEFEILLDIVDINGYNDDNIKLIVENLPQDYDLSIFPLELLQKMYEIASHHMIIISCNNVIYFFDGNNGDIIKTWEDPTQNKKRQKLLENYGRIVGYKNDIYNWNSFSIEDYKIFVEKILPINENKIVYMIKSNIQDPPFSISQTILFNIESEKTTSICNDNSDISYSRIHNNLAYVNPSLVEYYLRFEKIKMCTLTGDIIKELPISKPLPMKIRCPPEGKNQKKYYKKIIYSPNGKYICCTDYENRGYINIEIIDNETGYLIRKFECSDDESICFSPDDNLITFVFFHKCFTWNIKSNEKIDEITIMKHNIMSVYYTGNENFIVVTKEHSLKNIFSRQIYIMVRNICNKKSTIIANFNGVRKFFYCPVRNYLIILKDSGINIINPETGKSKKKIVCSTINQYLIDILNRYMSGYCLATISNNNYVTSKRIKKYLKTNKLTG
ncbi:hypothetical protein QJ850_gp086 [Acanthamoeba polyphaga mimivirus]|uniref:BTB/POZ domain-containing protein n=1 Tax=Acanthamoeba polyphaga mimivirus Kroon TaxID=3069720 RepID=A0A0G2Y483_9VIRU|nr:hypothetical protein QJ850_gp086 [Acanthamoeba polyphaga mimivirus]AKI80613.1 hypothetical protein [Acanthamoeba polyphaga mimivirus Kroon]